MNIAIRRCYRCKIEYNPAASNQMYCEKCIPIQKKEYDKKYREENREQIRESKRIYHLKNRDKIYRGVAKWKRENRKKVLKNATTYSQKVKLQAYLILSEGKEPQCALYKKYNCCRGQSDYRILQIDHIDGKGAQHRKDTSDHTYRWIRKHPEEAKKKLQIVCSNANWIKRHENKEVPKRPFMYINKYVEIINLPALAQDMVVEQYAS